MVKKRAKRRRPRTKKRSRRRTDRRIPIIPTIALASTFITPAPSGNTLISRLQHSDFTGFLYDAREKFVGIDAHGKIQWHWLFNTYAPIVASGLISKFLGRFVNKHIAKVPIVGKYIKL